MRGYGRAFGSSVGKASAAAAISKFRSALTNVGVQAERLHAVERAGQLDRVERAEGVTRGKIARPAQERARNADNQVLPLSVEQEVVVQLGDDRI